MGAENYFRQFLMNENNADKCIVCGKSTNFRGIDKGFAATCSRTCLYSPAGIKFQQKQREKAIEKKYGVKNVGCLGEVIQKREQTMQKRYGVNHALQHLSSNEKMKKTLSERTEDQKLLQRERTKNTIEKNPNYDIERRKKYVNTMMEKYGVVSYMHIPGLKENITFKAAVTKLKNNFDLFVEHLKEKNIVPLFSADDINEKNNNDVFYQFQCLDCKRIWEQKDIGLGKLNYIHCNCKRNRSYAETEIVKFLTENNIKNIEINKRFNVGEKCLELDIFLPDFNIGIEYDGLFWHNYERVGSSYHVEKNIFFQKFFNIRVVHIFEHEWQNKNKQEIVKSILKQILKITTTKLQARKSTIRTLVNSEYQNFLTHNHIQGYCPAKYIYGLFNGDELVSVMSMNRGRFRDNYELIRFCTKKDVNIIGGFSKLLKHIVEDNKITSLDSYCDLRYFNGSGYIKNNFDIVATTKPNYYYFDQKCWNTKMGIQLYNRIRFQKHKLEKLLEKFDKQKTEYQNMKMNGFLKIYDCGNIHLRFTKIKS